MGDPGICPRCGHNEFTEHDAGPDTWEDDISYTIYVCEKCGLQYTTWSDKWFVEDEDEEGYKPEPWFDYLAAQKLEIGSKLDVAAPPCPDCAFWNPTYGIFDHCSESRMCHAENMYKDFSCYVKRWEEEG